LTQPSRHGTIFRIDYLNVQVGSGAKEVGGQHPSATLRLHPAVEKDRPALAAYVARDVAVGIRSEDMEDARVKIGDQIEVVVDTERMHFFDPETGNAIRD
jgi:hypothetical protein